MVMTSVLSSVASIDGELGEHDLAEAVGLAPALQRGDGVGGRHGAAVVERQAVAQRDRVDQAVVRHVDAFGHLRLHLEVRVDGEERVVDQVAGVADGVVGGGDRVDGVDVAVHPQPQDVVLRPVPAAAGRQTSDRKRRPASAV